MAGYPSSRKQCATCAFWTGQRAADRSGQNVSVLNANDKGNCAIPKGGTKGQSKNAIARCSSWQKWPILK